MGWGLIPHWSKTPKSIQINARLETVATKPAFKRALSLHRCLIPADGFYEWEPKEQGRTPHWIFRADGHPMTFAGIWGAWKDPETGEWTRRFAIVTTKAEGIISEIHDRMPVALPEDLWEPWLDRDRPRGTGRDGADDRPRPVHGVRRLTSGQQCQEQRSGSGGAGVTACLP
jgi:putative SOS response-associated peptidase YedK